MQRRRRTDRPAEDGGEEQDEDEGGSHPLGLRVCVWRADVCVQSLPPPAGNGEAVLERSLPERAFSEFPPKTGVSTATGPRCLLGLWYFTGSGSGLNYRHTGVFLLRPGQRAITQLLPGCEKSSLLWFLNYFQSVLTQRESCSPDTDRNRPWVQARLRRPLVVT